MAHCRKNVENSVMYQLKQGSILFALAACFFITNITVFANATPMVDVVSRIAVPTFESVSVENAALKINGFSSPGTEIELLNGARQLGRAITDVNGHFTITVPLQLVPGVYQWVLRSTEVTGHSATSIQTLILTMPKSNEQRILAMLEEPGKPGRLMFDDNNPVAPVGNVDKALLIELVSYDQGTLSVSGRAKSEVVFITVDNKRVAMSKVGDDNRFFVVRSLMLLPGDHIVSANLIDENGDVTSTAWEPFQVKVNQKHSVLPGALELTKTPPVLTPEPIAKLPAHTVTVRPGDTLQKISLRVYGSSKYAKAIFNANRKKLSSKNNIKVGDVLLLPLINKH